MLIVVPPVSVVPRGSTEGLEFRLRIWGARFGIYGLRLRFRIQVWVQDFWFRIESVSRQKKPRHAIAAAVGSFTILKTRLSA